MTDREMLEFAAKAAGRGSQWWMESVWNGPDKGWTPRDDDGDAFRLMVASRLELEFGTDFVSVGRSFQNDGEWHLATEFGSDLRAATRLAIFRAAVEIGKAMKEAALRREET